jgi:hypothetical protein
MRYFLNPGRLEGKEETATKRCALTQADRKWLDDRYNVVNQAWRMPGQPQTLIST